MPHIIIEHSQNFATPDYIETLVNSLHAEAMKIEALPVGGLRIRTVGCEPVKVGDGDPKNQFIYLTVRLGQGRSEAVKREIGDRLFKIVTSHTQDNFAKGTPLSLGLEIQEIEKDWTWKKNNIHQIIKDKS